MLVGIPKKNSSLHHQVYLRITPCVFFTKKKRETKQCHTQSFVGTLASSPFLERKRIDTPWKFNMAPEEKNIPEGKQLISILKICFFRDKPC